MDEMLKRQERHQERLRSLREQEERKHHLLRNLVPLPQRAAHRPWKDLAYVLSRTARRMGYERPE